MVPRNAQEAQQQATSAMMGRLFRAPRPGYILGYTVLGSLLTGLLVNRLSLDLLTLVLGLGGFAAPVVASTLITKPLAEGFGGKMYLRRSALLGLLGLAMVFLAALTSVFFNESQVVRFLIVGWASTLWLRQAAILATSHSSPLHSLPAVINQPVLGILALVAFFPMSLLDWLIALISSVAFYGAGLLFTEVSIIPLERASGVDGLSMMRYSLDHMTERGMEGREQMEAFFESFAHTVTVPVGILSLRLEGGENALLVVPSVHPGPYGQLGGSDLPSKLATGIGDLASQVMVPKGPSTHDQNPATSRECDRLAAWVRDAVPKLEYHSRASRFVRVVEGKASVCCQIFDGKALILASLAPNPTDDIDFATGFSAARVAKESGAEDALFVDAHNCLQPGSGAVYFGTEDCFSILEATRRAVGEAQETVSDGFRAGVGEKTDLVNPEMGLGPRGIQAVLLEVDGQRTAYILFDGNNMVPGLREKLLSALEDLVDEAEVMTSDNHIVNNALPGFNPVGWRMDHDLLVRSARAAVEQALGSLEKGTAATSTGVLEGVKVWGHQTAVRLTTAIQSSISTMRLNAAVTFSLAAAVSVLALALVP